MEDHPRLLAICNYPSEARPAHQVFVRALLLEIKALGVDVTVIAPESLWNVTKPKSNFQLAPLFDDRDGIPVYRPRYMTYSNIRLPFGGTTSRWVANGYVKAVLRQAKKLQGTFDFCMGHFLYPQGYAAIEVGSALGIPTVISLGESSFERYENTYQPTEISRLFEKASGVISNSELIKERCVTNYGVQEGKIRVWPNGVDEQRFYPRDRQTLRKQLHLPAERPIVVFTGQFIDRKGPLRVLEAIKSRPEIGAVFLGYGPQVPQGTQVLFQGQVPHDDVPLWVGAADLFVLPTLNEGCSNAVLEALFCGVPVISSDMPFNHGILNEKVSTLVDPRNVASLAEAISSLIDSPERRTSMGKAALEHANSFRLKDRARNVLNFLQALPSGH